MVLEGGYSLEALTGSVAALAPVLGGSVPVEEEALEVHPLAERAVDRLARWWPALC
jgi:hypothetical protein